MEAIIAGMDCPKQFACYVSNFQRIGRARLVGDAGLVECLAEQGSACRYGQPFGATIFCRCALRKYILETFGR